MQKRVIQLLQAAPRVRKFTGLAAVDDCTVAVTSEQHLFTLKLTPTWSPGRTWPQAFRHAAATLWLIAKFGHRHASKQAEQHTSLWSLPPDVVAKIVHKAAGDRLDWLGSSPSEQSAACEGAYQGLTKAQLTDDLVQKPLCQLHQGHTQTLFDPACSLPQCFMD